MHIFCLQQLRFSKVKQRPENRTSNYRDEIKSKEIVAALQVIGWSEQPVTPRRQLLLASSSCTPDSTTSETF